MRTPPVSISTSTTAAWQAFGLSPSNGQEQNWTRHASGKLRIVRSSDEQDLAPAVSVDALRRHCDVPIDLDGYIETVRNKIVDYGPSFRGMSELWRGGDDEGLALSLMQRGIAADSGAPSPGTLYLIRSPDRARLRMYAVTRLQLGRRMTLISLYSRTSTSQSESSSASALNSTTSSTIRSSTFRWA